MEEQNMCTAATYKTKDFYFGRTLDYEISYGDQVVITPRNYVFDLRRRRSAEKSLCHDRNGMCYGELSSVL